MKKNKITIIYDDSRGTSFEIRSITGKSSFGDTILKRKTLRERTLELVESLDLVGRTVLFTKGSSYQEIDKSLPVVRLFSDFIIRDEGEVQILFEKALYADEIYRVSSLSKKETIMEEPQNSPFMPSLRGDSKKQPQPSVGEAGKAQEDRLCAVIYPSFSLFMEYMEEESLSPFDRILTDAFFDLSDINNFRQYITSGFDARFFNALSGDEYTVVKSSSNKEKLRAEYEYYRLLPDDMRMWYALAFNYRESEKEASYTMERFHFTDLALRYVHGAIGKEEFARIMDKLFFFIRSRKKKEVTPREYEDSSRALYIDKVKSRLSLLKEKEEFNGLNGLIKAGTEYNGIEEIFDRYYSLYENIIKGRSFEPFLVVGHGDLCFSNILYNKEAEILKLIDPKGAMTEEDLYMDPFYDLCKLSHSIYGSYDYFNSGLFEISMSDENRLTLSIDADNEPYIRIFSDKLRENGYDLRLIRLYEASLFLSMLPLHIDRKKKVLGFILNAVRIMDEIS